MKIKQPALCLLSVFVATQMIATHSLAAVVGGPTIVTIDHSSLPLPITGTAVVSGTVNVDTVNRAIDVQSLLAGYGANFQYLITGTPSPSFAGTDPILPSMWSSLIGAAQPLTGALATSLLTEDNLMAQRLTSVPPPTGDRFGFNSADELTRLALCIPGSDTWVSQTKSLFSDKTNPCQSYSIYSQSSSYLSGDQNYPFNGPFMASTLFEPLVYPNLRKVTYNGVTQTISEPPLDFITFVTNLTQPASLPQEIAGTPPFDATTLTDSKVMSKLLNLRSLAANYSLATYVFNRVYADRMPTVPNSTVDSQGKKHYTIAAYQTDMVSPAQIEYYMATRRIQDDVWRRSIETASPVALQREMVYAQADQLYETYQLRRSIEQMTAVLSSMQISLLGQSNKGASAEAQSDAAKKAVKDKYNPENPPS